MARLGAVPVLCRNRCEYRTANFLLDHRHSALESIDAAPTLKRLEMDALLGFRPIRSRWSEEIRVAQRIREYHVTAPVGMSRIIEQLVTAPAI